MTHVHAIRIAVPPHRVRAAEAAERLRPFFVAAGEDPRLVEQVFANAGVEERALARPQDFYLDERGLTARSAAYQEVSQELGITVARDALQAAGVRPEEVDLVVDTSCTGVSIPALDAVLVNALELRRDVRRMPLTEVGCAAGAVGLSRARDHLLAYPDATVLVVCVELPSLTLQVHDGGRANLVSAAIFGDGAAAAVVSGRTPRGRGVELCASRSFLFPASLDVMGFELKDSGFHIVLSQRIPRLVRQELRGQVDAFLADQGVRLDELEFFALHPGGARVLDNVEEVLELRPEQVDPARTVLRRHGNLSSASVLFVAQELLAREQVRPGALGLMVAMGPGFALELLLLRGSGPA